jgi:hypothetical protein
MFLFPEPSFSTIIGTGLTNHLQNVGYLDGFGAIGANGQVEYSFRCGCEPIATFQILVPANR